MGQNSIKSSFSAQRAKKSLNRKPKVSAGARRRPHLLVLLKGNFCRVVNSRASVSFVQARMGVAPGWGGAGRLVELLGRRRALQLLLSCRKVTVQEGLELGLFDNQVCLS